MLTTRTTVYSIARRERDSERAFDLHSGKLTRSTAMARLAQDGIDTRTACRMLDNAYGSLDHRIRHGLGETGSTVMSEIGPSRATYILGAYAMPWSVA